MKTFDIIKNLILDETDNEKLANRIADLLSEYYELIPNVWPYKGCYYYAPHVHDGLGLCCEIFKFDTDPIGLYHLNSNLCFKTKEECEKYIESVINKNNDNTL